MLMCPKEADFDVLENRTPAEQDTKFKLAMSDTSFFKFL